jgi:hypothetical protein
MQGTIAKKTKCLNNRLSIWRQDMFNKITHTNTLGTKCNLNLLYLCKTFLRENNKIFDQLRFVYIFSNFKHFSA